MEENPPSQLPGLIIGVLTGLVLGALLTVLALRTPPGQGFLAQLAPMGFGAAPANAATARPAGGGPQEVSAAAPGSATQAEVVIGNMAFSPHTLVVPTGAMITWRNRDSVDHTVTSPDGWFDSGQIPPNGQFQWQANKPGSFTYRCNNHPGMEGTIVVQPGGAVAASLFGGRPAEQAYGDSCGGCHGPHREGATGPALIPERLTQKDDFYFDVIKNGRPGTVMPAWGAQGLSDEEIWALVGYIRSEPKAEDVRWGMEQIRASREQLVDEASLPSRPTHNGNLDNLLLVTEREGRKIAVIDGDTHTLLGKVDASYRAHGYTFDPTSDRWAYNVGRDGWVFKIDLYTLRPVAKTKVGLDSRGIAMSDDGRYIIIGNYVPASAVILDAKTLEPVKVIETEATNPEGKMVKSRVCITSDVSPKLVGPYFILALKEAGQMWRIDWSKPDFPIEKVEKVGHILHDGFLSPDNKRFYIASQTDNWMGVIDVANWTLVDKISTGKTPHPGSGAAWTASDGHVYGATTHAGEGKIAVWDLADDKIAASIATTGPGLFIRSNENSPYVWADTMFAKPANHIYVFDKNPPFKVVKVIEEGTQPLHPEFTDDGKFVYVADWQDGKVRVYNATSFEKVAEIDGIATPTGIFNSARRLETLGH
jgi:nitrite reductase (NO-forming) / hydroxylamine reductase